jgi:hypothetical protein
MGFRAETQGRGGGKETADWTVAEFFTTEESGTLRNFEKISRAVCDDPIAAIESRSGFRYGGV